MRPKKGRNDKQKGPYCASNLVHNNPIKLRHVLRPAQIPSTRTCLGFCSLMITSQRWQSFMCPQSSRRLSCQFPSDTSDMESEHGDSFSEASSATGRLKVKTTILHSSLRNMGPHYGRIGKGVYIDGHERRDVRQYRQDEFVPRWLLLRKRVLPI